MSSPDWTPPPLELRDKQSRAHELARHAASQSPFHDVFGLQDELLDASVWLGTEFLFFLLVSSRPSEEASPDLQSRAGPFSAAAFFKGRWAAYQSDIAFLGLKVSWWEHVRRRERH